jgi:hypothetical protein
METINDIDINVFTCENEFINNYWNDKRIDMMKDLENEFNLLNSYILGGNCNDDNYLTGWTKFNINFNKFVELSNELIVLYGEVFEDYFYGTTHEIYNCDDLELCNFDEIRDNVNFIKQIHYSFLKTIFNEIHYIFTTNIQSKFINNINYDDVMALLSIINISYVYINHTIYDNVKSIMNENWFKSRHNFRELVLLFKYEALFDYVKEYYIEFYNDEIEDNEDDENYEYIQPPIQPADFKNILKIVVGECCVCYDNNIECFECVNNHILSCVKCSENINKCPICRYNY